jgi:esterase/lipase
MPLEKLMSDLEKSSINKHNSLIQAIFSFQDATHRKTQFGDIVLEQTLLHPGGVAHDLTLWFKYTNQGLNGAIEYRTDLFDESLIMTMAKDFGALLDAINENPNIPLSVLQARFRPRDKLSDQSTMPPKPTVTDIILNRPTTPFFFDSKGKQLFGIFYPAQSQVVSDTAILLCYPIGQEYIRSHWAFQQLATQLASKGFPVLRFEYYATGDSSGESTEGSVSQWKADVFSARNTLLSMSGAHKVSVVGLRFGATIAALAVNDGLDIQDLILWDPVVNGSNYLREIKTLYHMMFPSSLHQQLDMRISSNDQEEIMGFPFPMSLQHEIEAIDLSTSMHCNACKIFVVSSQDNEQDLNHFKALKEEINYRYISDAGDWNTLAKANSRLISPMIIQAIIALTGRLR